METSSEVKKLVEDLCAQFPSACEHVRKRLEDLGFEQDAYAMFLELFADVTTEAMRASDSYTVVEHLHFMSRHFEAGGPEVKEYIDVCYVENLMRDLSADAKRWAWEFFPRNLKDLYVRMWGEQRF